MLKDIQVGDIIVLSDGQIIPADCVLLKVTAGSEDGAANIQTA